MSRSTGRSEGLPRRAAAALAVSAVVLYNSWVLFPLNGNPNALGAFSSEFAALDQPHSWVFRAADRAAALVWLGVAAAGTTRWRGWVGRRARWTAAALAISALATIADSSVPLPCAPTFDAACRAAEQTTPDPNQTLHAVTSSLVMAGLVGSMLCAVWGLHERSGWTREARGIVVLGVVMLGATGLSLLWYEVLGVGHGYIQIVHLLAASGWVGWLAWRLAPSTMDA